MLQISALFINLLLDINGVYSYFVGPNKLTYEAAQAYCVENDANLASITSAGEQTEAQTKCFGEATYSGEGCWFGLNDKNGEGLFSFIDGESFGVGSYTNWYPGEPNNAGNEDCVEVSFGFDGQWNDLQCGVAQYPLCKKPKCLDARECYRITDEETCLSSRDSRAGWLNQPCTWCHGGACTGNNGNRCEPTEWLFERSNQLNPGDYEIASSGLISRTCYTITDRAVCLSSKDDRADYLDEPCVWCAGGACTGNNGNQCEPAGWLFKHTDQRNAAQYEVAVACVGNQAAYNIQPVMDFTNNKVYSFAISQSTFIFIFGIIMLLLIANIIVMWCLNCGRKKRPKYTAVKVFDSSADEMEKKELNL